MTDSSHFIGKSSRVISVTRIGKRVARVTPKELAQVIEGLNEIIGG